MIFIETWWNFPIQNSSEAKQAIFGRVKTWHFKAQISYIKRDLVVFWRDETKLYYVIVLNYWPCIK